MGASRQQDGSVLVESALSLMVFFMLVLGIVEIARVLQVQNMLTDAAREGARFGVTPLCYSCGGTLPTAQQISDKVTAFLAVGSITVPSSNVAVNQALTFSPDPTTYTRVTVTLSYSPLFGAWFQSLQINLIGSSLMRNETSP
jgi:Flp pilus assembly protein TadG